MRGNRPLALLAAVLAAFTAASYFSVLESDFLLYDDAPNITEHLRLRSGLTWENVRWALLSTEKANWFPLTWLSHLADIQLFGLRPAGHHLNNLLLHLANASLVLAVLNAATGSLRRSALAAALFALHPLHVESVAWVTQRKDLLCTFFWLLTMGAYLRYARRPSPRRYALMLVLAGASLLSKPLAVTLPFALLLLDFWPLGRWRRAGRSPAGSPDRPEAGRFGRLALLAEKLPLFLLAAADAMITYRAQSAAGALGHVAPPSLLQRLASVPPTYLRYLAKTFWPARLSVLYPVSPADHTAGKVAAAALALAAATALLLWFGRRRGYPATGWLWFLGVLVPMLGIVQVGGQTMADRYAYVPHLGLFVLLVWGARDIAAARRKLLPAAGAAGLLLLVLFASLTRQQAQRWRSTVTLFSEVVDSVPGNWMARLLLGVALSREGRFDESNARLTESLALFPRLENAHLYLGLNEFHRGRLEQAARQFAEELELAPRSVNAHFYLGQALGALGQPREAARHFSETVRLDPQHVGARVLLGTALADQGRWAEAASSFLAAVQLDPGDTLARAKAAEALQRLGAEH